MGTKLLFLVSLIALLTVARTAGGTPKHATAPPAPPGAGLEANP